MKAIKDVFYTENNDNRQTLDIYLPDTDSFKVFVYFHGGGLKGGSKNGYGGKFAEYLTSHGICVVSAEYRMYPDAEYPDFIVDAASAVAWVKKNIGRYGNSQGIYVGGSSAGGFLSMMLCFDDSYLGAHGILPTDIDGYVHDAGQPTAHFNVLRERGYDHRRVIVDETAPLFYVGLAERYSPMLIIYSDNDMVNRPQQTEVLITTLKHFKYDMSKVSVICKNGTHCAYVDRIDEEGESEFAKMIAPFILGE